jgi:NAD(P)-dependent dehydrogenase (short-subunit alcohol dehydrogenase family)
VALSELFDLSGRNAIVTGGGSGLGRAFAAGLAEAGANLVLCARDEARCREAADELAQAHGVAALGAHCDLREPDSIQAIVELTKEKLGSVDILVNNAGTSWGASVVDYPLAGWRKVVDVNLTGVFLFAQAAGRRMIEEGRGGKIVNIASVAAFRAAPPELMDAVGYSASKGGVVSLTRDLAAKWARYGIRVNAIAPGWFPTEMSQVLLERSGEAFLQRIPLRRFGGADDLKGAIVFLSSPASDYVTGQTLLIDGGQSIS